AVADVSNVATDEAREAHRTLGRVGKRVEVLHLQPHIGPVLLEAGGRVWQGRAERLLLGERPVLAHTTVWPRHDLTRAGRPAGNRGGGLLGAIARVNQAVYERSSDRDGDDNRSGDQRHPAHRRQREAAWAPRLLLSGNRKHALAQLERSA